MKFKRAYSVAAIVVLSLGCARAGTIRVAPVSPIGTVGQNVVVDIIASGFVEGGPPSIGVYDLGLTFDQSVLYFENIAFGTGLDVFGLGSLTSATPGAGTLELFELSLDSASDLNSLQPDTFTLAELTFRGLKTGTASINFTSAMVGDADGNSLSTILVGATVGVGTGQPTSVTPEPSGLVLSATIAMMLAAVVTWSRYKATLPS